MSCRIELLVVAKLALVTPEIEGATLLLVDKPGLGEDTELHGAAPAVVAAYTEATSAAYLRVDDADLAAAERRAADAVETLVAASVARLLTAGEDVPATPPVVVDLATLDARFVEEAAARLRLGRTVARLWIGMRREGEGLAMETFGFRKLGQRELHVVPLAEELTDVVGRFVNKLFEHVVQTGASLDPGDAAAFGWVDLRFFPAEKLDAYPDEPALCAPRFVRDLVGAVGGPELPGVLVLAEPVTDEPGSPYREGAARAAEIVQQMLEVGRRCGYEAGLDVPRALQTAVVCRGVRAGAPVQARRAPRDEPEASGWVAICGDPDHDHEDPASFDVVPVVLFAERAPALFSLLAAPAGTGVTLGGDGTLTIHLPDAYAQPI